MAVRGDEAPLVVELKLSLNLEVILQDMRHLPADIVAPRLRTLCDQLRALALKDITARADQAWQRFKEHRKQAKRERAHERAQALLEQAWKYRTKGWTTLARATLKTLITHLPEDPSAKEARELFKRWEKR